MFGWFKCLFGHHLWKQKRWLSELDGRTILNKECSRCDARYFRYADEAQFCNNAWHSTQ